MERPPYAFGIVSTYQKYSFEPEMRKALDRWGEYVENLPRTIIARPVEIITGSPMIQPHRKPCQAINQREVLQ